MAEQTKPEKWTVSQVCKIFIITTLYVRQILFTAALLLLSACASLVPQLDPPMVSVDNVRALPSPDAGPRFEVSLRISNPNDIALDIAGISYTVDVLGRSLVSGVSADIPRIEAYSEETVKLVTGVNLLQMLRLLADMGISQQQALDYRFSAKIDFRGLVPTQRVVEEGSFKLRQ
ncbi:MAG: LEA type 2 family protein [Parahaliea sp.]